MVHAGGQVVEAARSELVALPFVLEDHRALDHRMGLVRAVPVHRDVHLLRHANQQLGGVCFGVDAENRHLRAVRAQFGDDRLPLQIRVPGARRVQRARAWPASRRRMMLRR